jgi:acyl carrier protein
MPFADRSAFDDPNEKLIEIPDEDAEKIQAVRDAYAYVEQHKG